MAKTMTETCDAREDGTGLRCELRWDEHRGRTPLHAANLSRRWVVRWNAYETRVEHAPLRSGGKDSGRNK